MPNEIIIGIVMLLIGAGFTQLLRASGAEARETMNATRIGEIIVRLGHLERSLADGGPAPLAQRVQRVENMLSDVSDKIDQLYRAIVLEKR